MKEYATAIVAIMMGSAVIAAMIYGYTIDFKLPLPHIELNLKRDK